MKETIEQILKLYPNFIYDYILDITYTNGNMSWILYFGNKDRGNNGLFSSYLSDLQKIVKQIECLPTIRWVGLSKYSADIKGDSYSATLFVQVTN